MVTFLNSYTFFYLFINVSMFTTENFHLKMKLHTYFYVAHAVNAEWLECSDQLKKMECRWSCCDFDEMGYTHWIPMYTLLG